MSQGKGLNDSLVERERTDECWNWDEDDELDEAAMSSFLIGTQRADEFGPDLLVAELEEASDALEQMESRVEVKLMVGEAVQKGILTALEWNASEALEAKIAELQKVKEQLQEKDSMVDRLVNTLQEKEDLLKPMKERTCTQREGVLGKLKESEIKSHEQSPKIQQKQFKENARMLREAEDRISFLEQEVAVKEGLLQKHKNETEDQSWRFEFEEKFLSTYVESSFQEFSKKIVEMQGNLVDVNEKLVNGQDELEAAREKLKNSKAEDESLKSESVACPKCVDRIQTEDKSKQELVQARTDLQGARLETERGEVKINEEWTEMNSLRKELEVIRSKNTEEAVQMEESEWKSRLQSAIILGLVEGSSQECGQEFTRLREDLKVRDLEIQSLRFEVENQTQKVASHASEVMDLKNALISKDKELGALRQGSESTSGMQQDARVQEKSTVRGAAKEIEDLKELPISLPARIDEDRLGALQVEDAVAEQKWKDQVELDMVSTVFWEGKAGIIATWNKERAVLLGEAQMHQELGGQQPSDDKEEGFSHASQKVQPGSDVVIGESNLVTGNDAQDDKISRTVQPESVGLLVRQNSELRIEKERLLEQKTDEIYKLKAQFYKELERIKGEWKSDTELTALKRESAGLSENLAALEKEKNGLNSAHEREKEELIASYKKVLEEKDTALRREKEELVASYKKVLEEKHTALSREKEELIASYKTGLEEKDTVLRNALKDIDKVDRHIAVLEAESSHSRHEIEVLRMGMLTLRKYLESDLAGQMQALVASSQQLDNDVAQRMQQYDLRLEGVHCQLNSLLPQFRLLLTSETNNQQNAHNLQKAEAEVDMLGDEVDALVDVLEKVYGVLNHYSPVLQHYPGLAELVIVLRQEVLHRFCDNDDSSIVTC